MHFMDIVDRCHSGKVRIEIDLARSNVQFENAQVARVEMWIRILLGLPDLIGGEFVYPVELPGVGTYDRRADGDVPDEQIGRLALQRALDVAWRGASALLDVRPTTPVEFSGVDRVGAEKLTSILKHLTN